MGLTRKRKTKRDKAVKEGIPVAKLGAEFEWIDDKLKVGLEAYPTFKRPLGKAEINMMLALNMYYDDITKKWKVMDSLDISTVKNLARFYLSDPPALTTDVFEYMRIDKNHRLECVDNILDIAMRPIVLQHSVVPNETSIQIIESVDYPFDNLTVCIYNVVGNFNNLNISYLFPDATEEVINNYVLFNTAAFDYYKLKTWTKIKFYFNNAGASSYDVRVLLSKKHKYYP